MKPGACMRNLSRKTNLHAVGDEKQIGDTALMKKIGQDIKLMTQINGGKTIGRSTAIDAVKNGCAAIVRDLATPEVKDAFSSGRITAVEAAKRTHREKLSGK
jgi:hypothetical protein